MRVAVASGKGGTGKTFVTVNLARSYDEPVLVMDCDVEEPNSAIFLKGEQVSSRRSHVLIPSVNEQLCDGCRVCSTVCEFNAIAVIAGKPLIFEDLCHACGGCATFCPQDALHEVEHEIGTITEQQDGSIRLISGKLDVGKALAVPVIRDVKRSAERARESMMLIDSPPGTSCPMVWTVADSDLVILVTEPTAFGLHDLQLAVETVREIGVPFAVVLNKDGVGDSRVERYCEQNGIEILARIPHDRVIAELYAQGETIVHDARYAQVFSQLWQKIVAFTANEEAHRA